MPAAAEPAREVAVDPERLERWLAGFRERHGDGEWSRDGAAYLLSAGNGSTARLTGWRAADQLPPDLDTWARPPSPLAVLLLRRGGYGVARVERGAIAAHKVGSRRVQSRTAAGGWSQQRFARRRANQADALVLAAAGHAERVLGAGPFHGVVLGGDRALAGQLLELLAESAPALQDLPRREFYDLPDPNATVLKGAVRRALTVQIAVVNRD